MGHGRGRTSEVVRGAGVTAAQNSSPPPLNSSTRASWSRTYAPEDSERYPCKANDCAARSLRERTRSWASMVRRKSGAAQGDAQPRPSST